jgi:hypothetical protein
MGTVPRVTPLVRPLARLSLFAALSLALHAAALGTTLRRHTTEAPKAPAFDPSPSPLVGDTLDVEPASEPVDVDEATAANAAPGDVATPVAPSPATAPAPGPGRAAHPAAPGSPSPAPAPALFGAVGVRYATDLATTFTRGFPQAASADSIWGGAPFGPAGTAIVTLSIDESGHLTSSGIGGSPSPALRHGIERTLVLLGGRTFTARGAVTKLRVSARVSPNDVHDGLHGDVFALSGGSFAGEVGTAFFALPGASARRVDVELRLIP